MGVKSSVKHVNVIWNASSSGTHRDVECALYEREPIRGRVDRHRDLLSIPQLAVGTGQCPPTVPDLIALRLALIERVAHEVAVLHILGGRVEPPQVAASFLVLKAL